MTLHAINRDTPAFAAMVAALAAAELPTTDLHEGGAAYFVLGDGTAYGGLAAYGSDGLLRSLVVPAAKGRGTGGALLAALLDHAQGAGLRDVWLLTTTAEAFFTRHGFVKVERTAAPPAIAATSQFKDLCPASAAFMHKRIA